MKFVYPQISRVFLTDGDKVNTVIVENQRLFTGLISDVYRQCGGEDGLSVLSKGDKIIPFDKNAEILTQFIPFELNRKLLLSKMTTELEKSAVRDDNYAETVQLMGVLEAYLQNLAFEMSGDIDLSRGDIGGVIKAFSPRFRDDYTSLGEKIIDYFELVTEYEREKLFITVNLRSYISDEEAEVFLETALKHCYNLLMIESTEHTLLKNEQRYIVDSSLCEIC